MIGNSFWDKVSGASRFLSDAADKLSDGRSVMLDFDGDVPWSDIMIRSLTDRLIACLDSRSVNTFSVGSVKNPGEFLLKTYFKESERRNYWPTDSAARFIANNPNSTIHHRFVVLEDIPRGMTEKWASFVCEYMSCFTDDRDSALFVLITNNAKSADSKHLAVFNYDDYISGYDCLIYCMNILSDIKCSATAKKYLAELAVQLAEGQIETAGALAEYGVSLAEDTKAVLSSVVRDHSYDDMDDFIKMNTWEAQIRIVYPELEKFRRSFIRKYEEKLKRHLPVTDSSGEKIRDARELELGQLVMICSNETTLAEKTDYDRLVRRKNARNLIAHGDVIEYDDLVKLNIM